MAKKKNKKRTGPPPAPSRPSARSEKEQRRQDAAARRREQQAAEARRQTIRRTVTAGVVLTVALAALLGYAWYDNRRDDAIVDRLTAGGACTVDERSDPTGGPGQNHIPSPAYEVNPPAGGNHTLQVARAGVYSAASRPSDGQLVHALEHGYVVLWHKPGVDIAPLRRIAERHDGDVIVVERGSMDPPVAATAWGHRLLCSRMAEEPLAEFAETYIGKGPEKVSRG